MTIIHILCINNCICRHYFGLKFGSLTISSYLCNEIQVQIFNVSEILLLFVHEGLNLFACQIWEIVRYYVFLL